MLLSIEAFMMQSGKFSFLFAIFYDTKNGEFGKHFLVFLLEPK